MNTSKILEHCAINLKSDSLLYLSGIIWRISGLLSVIIGVPGHCLLIFLLSRKNTRKEPTRLYYIAIAICELIFLLALFWLWCAHMSLVKTDPRQFFSCGIFYGILIGTTALSNLYLAALSIDQSIIVIHPTRYRSIVTHSHVRIRLIILCIMVVLLLAPHHFYTSYEPKLTLFICMFHSSVSERKVRLWALIHAIILVSIPSIIVCISALILVQNRCKHRRIHQKNTSVNARRMQKQSLFIFFVTLGIFLCLLPSCVLEVFGAYNRLFYQADPCSQRWRIHKILLYCFLILTSINYSMKFYIHLILSTSIRKKFFRLISCKSATIHRNNR